MEDKQEKEMEIDPIKHLRFYLRAFPKLEEIIDQKYILKERRIQNKIGSKPPKSLGITKPKKFTRKSKRRKH